MCVVCTLHHPASHHDACIARYNGTLNNTATFDNKRVSVSALCVMCRLWHIFSREDQRKCYMRAAIESHQDRVDFRQFSFSL